jgi:uncharacterized protein (TIGR03435 family)
MRFLGSSRIQKRFGLRLEARKELVDALVIEHIERSSND